MPLLADCGREFLEEAIARIVCVDVGILMIAVGTIAVIFVIDMLSRPVALSGVSNTIVMDTVPMPVRMPCLVAVALSGRCGPIG